MTTMIMQNLRTDVMPKYANVVPKHDQIWWKHNFTS